jgi:hypothetical protein
MLLTRTIPYDPAECASAIATFAAWSQLPALQSAPLVAISAAELRALAMGAGLISWAASADELQSAGPGPLGMEQTIETAAIAAGNHPEASAEAKSAAIIAWATRRALRELAETCEPRTPAAAPPPSIGAMGEAASSMESAIRAALGLGADEEQLPPPGDIGPPRLAAIPLPPLARSAVVSVFGPVAAVIDTIRQDQMQANAAAAQQTGRVAAVSAIAAEMLDRGQSIEAEELLRAAGLGADAAQEAKSYRATWFAIGIATSVGLVAGGAYLFWRNTK